ncbi:uncharacterized protein OCT59_009833 [Rhizophagus irregularis]|uniref:Uncharacterized protein n=1 Tax=Rhizophagus irregularis (strain DAOM 181602 / DAOM 197198 / MUCL 43194) TaxID=747089 RepID=U9UTQ6_RHIID|nr:hypothetical protein OCT59_009833 [Rhizophagus irregularis]GBC29222.1 hypothetical protein GLOIN_2v1678875 [Rhizophagus irregularis DAOM 181602=DAOM 197198]
MTDNNTANDSSENTQDGRTHDLQASDNNNDSTKQEYEDLIKVLKEKDKEIETLKQKTIELENEANTTNYKQEYEDLKKGLEEKDKEIETLKQKTIELENEASKYQYALGAATDTRLSDNDENNPVNLKKDILSLQDSLKDYTVVKGKIDITTSEIQELLKKYGSNTTITEKDQNKLLVKAVLQRHVIEQICEYAKEYFDNPDKHQKYPYGMETYIFRKVKELIEITRNFAKRRVGIDESTKVLPVKLRQQVCAALGNRGFNDMIDNDKKTFTHYFISHFQAGLNNEMSKYREFGEPEKRKEIENMAGDIIKRAVALFWFRLKVQEPVVEYIWPKSDDIIDPSYMEGKWEDDEIDNLVVDICYFPLIAQEFSDESKRQIYTKAIIFQKLKPEQPPLQDDSQSAQSNKCSSVF